MALAFDVILLLCTFSVAALALYHPRIFAGAALFIVYGLLLSLIWVRLSAPDVALAEAALGAGITGVLLLGSIARLARTRNTNVGPATRKGAPIR